MNISACRSVVILLSFSALYVFLNVYARACEGPDAALAPRYAPFLLPGFIAVYLILVSGDYQKPVLRHLGIIIFIFTFSFFRFRPNEKFYNHIARSGLEFRKWYECYEENADEEYCTSITGAMPFGKRALNVDEKMRKFRKVREEYKKMKFQ